MPEYKQPHTIEDGNKAATTVDFYVSTLIDCDPLDSRTGTKFIPKYPI